MSETKIPNLAEGTGIPAIEDTEGNDPTLLRDAALLDELSNPKPPELEVQEIDELEDSDLTGEDRAYLDEQRRLHELGEVTPNEIEVFREGLEERLTAIKGIAEAIEEQRRQNEEQQVQVDRLAGLFGRATAARGRLQGGADEVRLSNIRIKQQAAEVFGSILTDVGDPVRQDEIVQNVYGARKNKPGGEAYPDFAEGIITEVLVGEEISAVVDALNGQGSDVSFRRSTTEEDTEKGYDFVVSGPDGKEMLVDAKSSSAFRGLVGDQPPDPHFKYINKGEDSERVLLVNPAGLNNPREGTGDSITGFQELGNSGRLVPSFERNQEKIGPFRWKLAHAIGRDLNVPVEPDVLGKLSS